MKKLTLLILMVVGTTLFANAQKHGGPQKMPKALVQQLALTADQQKKIDAIFKSRADKIDSLTANLNQIGDKQAKRQRRQVNTEMINQIQAVLTADQKKIYADFRAKRQEKINAKKMVPDSAAAPVK